jgi:hypothetical protein
MGGMELGIVITIVSVVASLVVFVGMALLMWKIFGGLMKQSQERQRLLMQGHPANGRILQLLDTGMMVNNSPQVRIILEVQPPGRPPYQAECTMIVSYLAIPRVQPGCFVPVKFDPMNPARIAIAI